MESLTQPEPTEKSSTPRAAATLHHMPFWKKRSRRSSSSTSPSSRMCSTRRAYWWRTTAGSPRRRRRQRRPGAGGAGGRGSRRSSRRRSCRSPSACLRRLPRALPVEARGGFVEEHRDLVEAAADGGEEEVALGREEAEDVGLGDADVGGDRRDLRPLQSAVGEVVDGGLDQRVPALGCRDALARLQSWCSPPRCRS